MEFDDKQRIIQEFVPGKQVTLAHVIANPTPRLYPKVGLDASAGNALGIMTITPSEAAIIAADIATKSSNVEIGFVDRFSGSLVILGQLSGVESGVDNIVTGLRDILGFSVPQVTRS